MYSINGLSHLCPKESVIAERLQPGKAQRYEPGVKRFEKISGKRKFIWGDLPWEIDYHQGLKAPVNKKDVRFFQIKRSNAKLYCYYQWPDTVGLLSQWVSVGLDTSRTIIADWQDDPYNCQSFFRKECQFHFSAEHW